MTYAAYAKKLSIYITLSKAKSHAYAKSHAESHAEFFYAESHAKNFTLTRVTLKLIDKF